MNALENIYSRRSIRSYNGESVTQEQLNEILKAAYAAPVGRGKYGDLALSVIEDKELLCDWEAAMANLVGDANVHPFYGAPTVILVSSVLPSPEAANVSYSNAATLVQNMALAATELGVGACHIWGAVRALKGNDGLLARLKVPENMTPCCAIALGQTNEEYSLRQIENGKIKTQFVK